MRTKQYLISAIATLAVLAALCTTASAGDYGYGCPFHTWYNGTVHGSVYFDVHGGYDGTGGPQTGIFENVPDGRQIVRFYPGIWLGSRSDATIQFTITTNGHADTYSFQDHTGMEWHEPTGSWVDPPVCQQVCEKGNPDSPDCTVDITGCGCASITCEGSPYIVTGNNTITFECTGEIYQFALLAVYEDPSMPEAQYWIKEGHEYPDFNYSVYFNETVNTGPINTSSLQSVTYWTYGYPHCPGNPYYGNITLNGHELGEPDKYGYGGAYDVMYRWTSEQGNIFPSSVSSPSNHFYYDVLGNDRMMVPVFILQHGETGPNQPPVADPNGPYNDTESSPITFDGSGSYDTDGSIVSYDWDFGDGNTGTGVSPTHTYALEGAYTVTLTVTDNDAATDTKTTTASVADADPIADFSGTPTHGPSPLTVVFTDASTSYDGITAWEWDFDNNGVVDSTVQNPTYVYEVDGVYSVKLTVHEADGDFDTEVKVDYIIVTAANIPPVADAGPDQTVAIGETVTFNGSGSYDSDGSIVSYDWDFGDGNTGTGEITTHAYSTDGTYTVTLTVTDNGGATDNDTAIVTVNPPGGYSGNHPLTIYEHGTIKGGLIYVTDETGSNYTRLYSDPDPDYGMPSSMTQEIAIEIPDGATVKTARLYNTYCWSTSNNNDPYVPGLPAQAKLTFSDGINTWTKICDHECPGLDEWAEIETVPNPIYCGDDCVHYWDTKGQGYEPPGATAWDYPSGEFAWDVTGMVTGSGPYTATIENIEDMMGYTPSESERFVTFGFGLLVVYEHPDSPEIEYWIAEGCDSLMARNFETPENAISSTTFGGVSGAVDANLTTVVACSDKGTLEPPQNMVYFNGVEIGPSTAVSDKAIGVDYFNVTGNLQTSQNVAEFQDRDDYETVHNAFLVVEVVSEPPVDDKANADIPVKGTMSGSYLDTHVSDNVCEAIEEVESKGKPTSRYSYLEHKWTIDVTGGSGTDAAFYVEAYHTANSEGDDFVFEYSKDDSTYTPMVTVTKTADDDTYQAYSFTEPISGTVYIRVRDTNRTAGNKVLDTISIDHMYIRSVSAPPSYGVTVTIDETSQKVAPGESTTYTARVKNTGGIEASYNVVMCGTAVDETTITVSPLSWNTGTLAPNTENVTTVTVSTTSSTPETAYTLTATATCEQDASATDSTTSKLVVSSATNTMHVTSIDMSLSDRTAGKNTFTHATVTVTIVDANGVAVEGATVSGHWSGATSDTDSGTTDASGKVSLDSDEVKSAVSGTMFIFTVDDVVLTGWTYDKAANEETSDSISVP